MNLIPPDIDVDAEWLRTLGAEQRFEWVDGQLKEKSCMGAKANRVATVLAGFLDAHARANHLGLVFTQECGYQAFPNEPRRVRFPDVSFVMGGRLPNDQVPDGHMKIPPDLEIEVVSPNDLAEDLEERVNDYLSVGVRLLWIIYVSTRSVWIVRRDGTAARLTETQDLSGEDVVAGFTCPLCTLFADL
ncbi:MAG TPA: Uma2 family endonuclease [Gemmataceae bacterium]|jgi:Uma2 family endonuclease